MDKIISIIKNYWKVILIAIVVMFLLITCQRARKLKQEIVAAKVVKEFADKKLDSTVKYWKDINGQQHAVIDKLEAQSYLQASFYIDSIAKLLSIKNNQVTGVTVIRSQEKIDGVLKTDTTFQPKLVFLNDSSRVVRSISFNWHDTWTSVNGSIGEGKDSIHVRGIDTIQSVDYWTRKKILGLKVGPHVGHVDFTNSNPHIEITGGKKIDIVPPKTRWSVGLGIGYGYEVMPGIQLKPSVQVGIQLQRTVIKF